MKLNKSLTMIAAVLTLISTNSLAAVTIDVVESGGDVVATASGSINTTDLERNINWSSIGSFVRGTGSTPPVNGQIILAPVSGSTAMASYTVSTSITFSTGPVIYASSSSGDRVGVLSTITSPITDLIYLETDYVSGAPLSATATWSGQSFADLGLIPGTYIVTWGSAENADSLTLNIGPTDPIPTYSVGGTVSGLTGSGLALQNNGADTLPVASDGLFTFATELSDNGDYEVTVSVQPSGQTCTVSNGSGTIEGADVTDVTVTCEDNPAPTYTVGGTVSGLSGSVTLTNNGTDDLVVNTNGAFEFVTALDDSSDYLVAVSGQPSGQTCTVSNGSGTIDGADITDVAVDCKDDPPPPVRPEPIAVSANSTWALVVLTLSLMLLGGWVLTRQR